MGRLIDGAWLAGDLGTDERGRYIRRATQFRDHITAAGSSGHPAEAGRYHLYVSRACPWAHRTLIARKLKGLEQAVSVTVVDPLMGEQGWEFTDDPDPVAGARYLYEVYIAARADYTGRASVPALWDRTAHTIVNNESIDIVRMFDSEFDAVGADTAVRLFPAGRRADIDAMIAANYDTINNGVYRAGFAGSQDAYEEAVRGLFARLDLCDELLANQRYLCGATITAADWCLFTTLIRFDAVYYSHFKCNFRRIADYPNLSGYTRDLYQVAGVADTCNFTHIKQHYYRSHESINPRRIVPMGPDLDFDAAHDRARF